MKILLTGKDGQVGFDLHNKLLLLGEIIATSRHELDLSHSDTIRKFIDKINPDMIINTAAYTNVERAESEIQLAYQINSEAPKILAEKAAELDIPLIHFSTDYVFDGLKTEPYIETDKTNPQSIYGKSKDQGEKNVSNHRKHIILRTSWVFSSRGHNFLKTILKLMRERSLLNVVTDQKGSPTSSLMLANATCKIVKKLFDCRNFSDFGTYHIASQGYTDWYQYATLIKEEVLNLGIELNNKSCDIRPVLSQEFPTIATRPANSMLNSNKIKEVFNIELPIWQDELKNTLKEINNI